MLELMGRSWEDIDEVPAIGELEDIGTKAPPYPNPTLALEPDLFHLLIGRSPSPADVDDAFGGFDSVVLGNLLHKNEVRLHSSKQSVAVSSPPYPPYRMQVVMKKVVRLGSSEKLNEEGAEDMPISSPDDT